LKIYAQKSGLLRMALAVTLLVPYLAQIPDGITLNPPTNRKVLVGKVEESIALRRDHQVELSANQYPNAVHPKGYQYLTQFEQNPSL